MTGDEQIRFSIPKLNGLWWGDAKKIARTLRLLYIDADIVPEHNLVRVDYNRLLVGLSPLTIEELVDRGILVEAGEVNRTRRGNNILVKAYQCRWLELDAWEAAGRLSEHS